MLIFRFLILTNKIRMNKFVTNKFLFHEEKANQSVENLIFR